MKERSKANAKGRRDAMEREVMNYVCVVLDITKNPEEKGGMDSRIAEALQTLASQNPPKTKLWWFVLILL